MAFLDNSNWVRAALANQIGRSEQELEWARNFWNQFADSLKDQLVFPAAADWRGRDQEAVNRLFQNLYGYNPVDVFRDSGIWETPESTFLRDTMGQFGFGLGDLGSQAMQGFASGGWNPQYQSLMDTAGYLLGGGNPAVNAGIIGGVDLLQSRGMDPMTAAYQDLAMRAMYGRGLTPEDEELAGIGRSMLAAGGESPYTSLLAATGGNFVPTDLQLPISDYRSLFTRGSGPAATPEEEQIRTVGRDIITGLGQTPQSQLLQNAAQGVLSRNPLMSPEQVTSFAAELAGQRTRQAAEEAYRRALARGGGPGSVVASGMQESALADFRDDMLRNQSAAIIDALMKQQGLGLEQWNQAGRMTGESAQLENQRLGAGLQLASDPLSRELQRQQLLLSTGSLGDRMALDQWQTLNNLMLAGNQNRIQALTNAGQLANQRLNIGASLMENPLARELSRQQMAFQAGQNADRMAIDRMQLGSQLLGQTAGLQRDLLGTMFSGLGNQYQFASGLGNLAQSALTQGGNMFGNRLQNLLQGGQLGLQRADAINRALQTSFGQQQDFTRQAASNYLSMALDPMFRLMQPVQGAFGTALSSITGGIPVGQGGGFGLGGQLLNTAISTALGRP